MFLLAPYQHTQTQAHAGNMRMLSSVTNTSQYMKTLKELLTWKPFVLIQPTKEKCRAKQRTHNESMVLLGAMHTTEINSKPNPKTQL